MDSVDYVEWSLTSHGSKAGVDMKRVPVPTQAVQSGLEPQDNRLNSAINPEPFTPCGVNRNHHKGSLQKAPKM